MRKAGYGSALMTFSVVGIDPLYTALGAEIRGVIHLAGVPSPRDKSRTAVVKEYLAALADSDQTASYEGLEGFIAAKSLAEAVRRAGPAPNRVRPAEGDGRHERLRRGRFPRHLRPPLHDVTRPVDPGLHHGRRPRAALINMMRTEIMKLHSTTLLALLIATAGAPAMAQVHRCVDDAGKVSFSDTVCNGARAEKTFGSTASARGWREESYKPTRRVPARQVDAGRGPARPRAAGGAGKHGRRPGTRQVTGQPGRPDRVQHSTTFTARPPSEVSL